MILRSTDRCTLNHSWWSCDIAFAASSESLYNKSSASYVSPSSAHPPCHIIAVSVRHCELSENLLWPCIAWRKCQVSDRLFTWNSQYRDSKGLSLFRMIIYLSFFWFACFPKVTGESALSAPAVWWAAAALAQHQDDHYLTVTVRDSTSCESPRIKRRNSCNSREREKLSAQTMAWDSKRAKRQKTITTDTERGT